MINLKDIPHSTEPLFPKYIKINEMVFMLRKAQTSVDFGNCLRWEYFCPKWCIFVFLEKDKDVYKVYTDLEHLKYLKEEDVVIAKESDYLTYNKFYL